MKLANAWKEQGKNEDLTGVIGEYIDKLTLSVGELTIKELKAELLMSEINSTWNYLRFEEDEAAEQAH